MPATWAERRNVVFLPTNHLPTYRAKPDSRSWCSEVHRVGRNIGSHFVFEASCRRSLQQIDRCTVHRSIEIPDEGLVANDKADGFTRNDVDVFRIRTDDYGSGDMPRLLMRMWPSANFLVIGRFICHCLSKRNCCHENGNDEICLEHREPR